MFLAGRASPDRSCLRPHTTLASSAPEFFSKCLIIIHPSLNFPSPPMFVTHSHTFWKQTADALLAALLSVSFPPSVSGPVSILSYLICGDEVSDNCGQTHLLRIYSCVSDHLSPLKEYFVSVYSAADFQIWFLFVCSDERWSLIVGPASGFLCLMISVFLWFTVSHVNHFHYEEKRWWGAAENCFLSLDSWRNGALERRSGNIRLSSRLWCVSL